MLKIGFPMPTAKKHVFLKKYVKYMFFGGRHRKTDFEHNQKYKKNEFYCSITNLTEKKCKITSYLLQ